MLTPNADMHNAYWEMTYHSKNDKTPKSFAMFRTELDKNLLKAISNHLKKLVQCSKAL